MTKEWKDELKAILFEGSSGRSRLRLIVSLCFAAVAAIGALGTVAWVTGLLTLAQINPLFVPIAPLAILLLVSLGASWFLYGVRPEYSIQVGVVGVLVVMLTSLTIYHAVMPGSFSIERLMFSNPATLSGYLLVEMSPIAAVMLFLGGLSLILLVLFSGTRTRAGIALFGIVILSCGVVTSIGYLYQTPLLYGSPTRPVSVLAGFAFLFLGTEVWAAAGRECWPTRSLVGDSAQARLLRAFLPAGTLIILALLGLDQIIGDIYPTSLVASLDLLGAFVAVIVIVGAVSRGVGGEVDRGIAERTRMEKAVRESEEKYRALVENSPNMIGIFQDGVLKYVNNAASLVLGWTYEELVSPSFDPIENVVSQKSRYLLKENVGKRLRGEDVAPYEISLTKKNGSDVPVFVRGAKIIYNQKQAIEFIFDDVTERRRAEEELRQSEERYRSLFDRMLDGVYLSTHEGRFVDVNPAFVKMFGYSSKKEVLDIADIRKALYFSPEERGSHILDTGKEEIDVYRMRGKDGSEIWVEDHGRYVHDERGNVIYHEGILRNVTERKRLQGELKQYSLHLEELVDERTKKLHESEEKYRELFEASPVSLWEEDFSAVKQFLDELRQKGVSDFAGYFVNHPQDIAKCAALVKVVDVNEATLNLYNAKSVDEIVERLSHILEESNPEFTGELVALAQGKTSYEAEMENHTLRGERMQCNLILAVVPGYEQSLSKVLISIVDLTAQKRLEEDLRASRKQLEYAVASNPAVIYVAKPLPDFSDYNATYISNGIALILGFESEELVGIEGAKLWKSRIPPEDFQKFRAEMPALWRDGHNAFEYRFLHKDGKYRWIHEQIRVMHDAEGRVQDVVGYWEDVTDRKMLEDELRATRERIEYVVALNPAVLVLEKPLPDLSNKFSTFVSESATFVLGFEPKNFLGESGSEFFNSRVHPDDLARYLAEVPSLWRDGDHTFEFRFLHSDGAYRWIREEMKVTRDAEGHVLDVVGVCIDVTERKMLEDRLAKTERLAVIGETAAMVGHDLRNPLQGIAGALHLLRQESLTAEERNEMLQVIENSVHYSDAIIRDLLDYSAEIKLKQIQTTLKSITRDVIQTVKIPQNVTVQDLSEDQPTLRVDPDRMKRVFINLIQNAIDAMPEGGTLTISSKQSNDDVEITISDTGSGMPTKIIENLWKPLQTTKAKGMGLGLSICKRIVDAHEGTINVKSETDEGTTVTIRLPNELVAVEVKQK